ncbi:DUF3306 domain-containing protein [Caenispirillum bisanense]|uniref:DUF3306 domain-containing protein n=1 Tax=Caenispirillum bisanense TaxID=414052 RepID=UPI0031DA169D
MVDDPAEGFLSRWSRLKQADRDPPVEPPPGPVPEPAPLPPSPSPVPPPADPVAAGAEAEAADPFDPADLPSIDSLGADSDYTVFLRKEVPESLRRLALRKAWSSDPAITGYKTFADYDWDFNAPGYAALRPTDRPEKLVERLFAHLKDKSADAPDAEATEPEAAAPPEGDGEPDADTAVPAAEEDPPATA